MSGQNVTATLKCPIGIVETPASGPLSGVAVPFGPNFQTVLKLSGVLADQVDTVYDNTLTFVASTPQSLDLTSLTDPLGNAVNFARARAVAFRNKSATDTHVLLVGDAVTNEWDAFLSSAGILTIFPSSTVNDGWVVITAPNTTGMVVSGSHKVLKLDPGSFSDIVLDVVILGCSS